MNKTPFVSLFSIIRIFFNSFIPNQFSSKIRLLLFLTPLLWYCEDNTVDPGSNQLIKQFLVDTIEYPGSFQTSMKTAWGTSIDDIYIAGHNNRGVGKSFHFDGNEWSEFQLIELEFYMTFEITNSLQLNNETFLSGTALFMDQTGNNTITDSSLIVTGYNNTWNVSLIGKGAGLNTIKTDQNGNIYAAGRDMTFLKYSVDEWIIEKLNVNISDSLETRNITDIFIDDDENIHTMVYLYHPLPYLSRRLYLKKQNQEWKIQESFNEIGTPTFGANFWQSNNGTIYSYYPGLYKLNGDSWEDLSLNSELITAVGGTDDNDIYVAGDKLFHFNGTGWYEYSELSNKYGQARDILIFDKMILVLFSASQKSYVIRGYK